ncbi:two-component sensor histidine kinase [Caulobacter sp. CCUG 60055]|uniref:HAMP domain-containing sensor histidine kinase n=1 Tax=Caulobacter sp. CCUG 60055 TaxID=2100090 RepID=UPI001FA71A64|nr:HAMP domain-containing sensor histidine kinase [Caulobacter sp. CCUG 60055]MBQ1542746.1 HAMP domain-containing histidine kinase [Caulobacteraceae bacterium]MCI3179544.1 two-component sensor histidine kinase [Caulobacter sp. CCUG 60055]
MALRSLRSLTIAFLLAFLAATIGTGLAIHWVTQATITGLVDQRVAAASKAVAGPPAAGSRPADILRRIAAFEGRLDTADIGFMLVDGEGRLLGGNIHIRRRLPVGFSTVRREDYREGLGVGRALVRDLGGGLRLTTVAEIEPFDDYDEARTRIYLVGFGSIVLIVIAGLIAFGLLIKRRIAAIRRTVDAIIDGDMQRRLPVEPSRGEFAQQAQAFNRMLDRITELMSGISNVSNDIAHDLRTPLARLRGQLERLAAQADTPPLRAGLEEAIAQADHLLAMFGAVLRIAEVEGGDRRARFEPLDLGALARDVGAMMQAAAAEEARELVVGPCDSLPVLGDRQLLTQALINVIENGLRHTPPGSRVVVGAARSPAGAAVTIADDGPGIAPDQREEAMRRFGRLDKSRNQAGHGLGLPLVEAIMRLHRGSLALEDAGPGLKVVLVVPAP